MVIEREAINNLIAWKNSNYCKPLFFDEIQECNDALNSLKYFQEDAPEYFVVCAGSLLGVALKRQGSSFPVGKVDFLTIYPVSFKEYLKASDLSLFNQLENFISNEEIPELLHSKLIDKYRSYHVCGGMLRL